MIEAALNFANLVTATIPQDRDVGDLTDQHQGEHRGHVLGTVDPATTTSVQVVGKTSNGTYNPWKAAAQKSGKFSIKVNMTAKGTFYFKAFLAAKAPSRAAPARS